MDLAEEYTEALTELVQDIWVPGITRMNSQNKREKVYFKGAEPITKDWDNTYYRCDQPYSLKLMFQCPECFDPWTTGNGTLLFEYQVNKSQKMIYFSVYIFTQQCKKCKVDGSIQQYSDEIERLAEQFYIRMKGEINKQWPEKVKGGEQRGSTNRKPHLESHCNACKNKVCVYMKLNRKGNKNKKHATRPPRSNAPSLYKKSKQAQSTTRSIQEPQNSITNQSSQLVDLSQQGTATRPVQIRNQPEQQNRRQRRPPRQLRQAPPSSATVQKWQRKVAAQRTNTE